MVYAYIHSKCTSLFLQNAHLYSKSSTKIKPSSTFVNKINIDLFETQISWTKTVLKKNNNKYRGTTWYQVSNYRIIIRNRPSQSHLVHHGWLTNSLGVTNEKAPIYRYIVTGIGFVCWDFSKVFSRTFRLDMAELTSRAVIKWYPIKNIS